MTDPDDPTATDAAVRAVAALLPFAVQLDADMGYTGALFIDLGRRGGPNDPPDTAGIDSEVQPSVWTFDIEGGRETIESALRLDADPADVAVWVTDQARRAQSPAAIAAAAPLEER
jgi:hypothetical protein